MFFPVVIMCYYELLLYYFIYYLKLYNYSYFPILYGYSLTILNILYPKLIDPKRYLNYKLVSSSSLFILPSISLWTNGYYFTSLVFGNVMGLSPPSDALLPYEDGEKNEFFYYMDVVNDVFGFMTIFLTIIYFENLEFNIKMLLVFMWFVPLTYWKFGLQYFDKWDDFHSLWHVISVSCGLFASEISRFYKVQ